MITVARSTLASAGVAALVVGAMAWVSVHGLRLERAERHARDEAQHQESLRLALWRMDAAVAPVIAREAARPYYEYQSFYAPGHPGLRADPAHTGGEAVVPSPLLERPDEFVAMHYQVVEGAVTSPQVPTGAYRMLAEPTFVNGFDLDSGAQRLMGLSAVLVPADGLLAGAGATQGEGQGMFGAEQQAEPNAREFQARGRYASEVANSTQRLSQQAKAPREDVPVTTPLASAQGEPTTGKAAGDASSAGPAPAAAAPPAPASVASAPRAKEADEKATSKSAAAGRKEERRDAARTGGKDAGLGKADLDEKVRSMSKDDSVRLMSVAMPEVYHGPFAAHWITRSGEPPRLVFEREVRVGAEVGRQGFVIDWESLRGSLEGRVRDLFPQAALRPLLAGVDERDVALLGRTLAVIPAELVVPGTPAPASLGLTPMRLTLGVAWVAVLFAIVAAGVLQRATSELAERRGQFVSAVTHELRTPLTTFVMYSQMLADGMIRTDEDKAAYLTTLKNESQRLARIVESVLDYARLTKRRASPVRTRLTADQLLELVRPALESRCTQAGMTLVVERAGDMTVPVETDAPTLERVLYNLVDNACKYASEAADKRVHLEVAGGREVVLRVRDHGPGVPKDQVEAIFRPFTRGEEQAHGSVPGLGLGLSLARGLARELGGDLRLVPGAGGGAEFQVRMPRAG